MSPREHHRSQAIDSLITAAHALQLPTTDNVALALLHLGIALIHVVRLDPEEKSLEIVTKALREARAA